MKRMILSDREDVRKIESEEQYKFTVHVLTELGIPLDGVLPEDYESFDVEQKIKLRKLLQTYDVSINDDRDGGVMIYVDQTLVAEWKKCIFNLRVDHSEVNPNKKMYAEVHINWTTVFDGDKDE